MSEPLVVTIPTRTHGRCLVAAPAGEAPFPWLVAFHGYGQNAAQQMEILDRIPGSDRWLRVAVQGLHRFYDRDQQVVASWMTREDRELAIADNIAYVGAVLDALRARYGAPAPLVFAGFSQGTAMAYRAAAHFPAAALFALAGDVPPDVAAAVPVTLPPVLVGGGVYDPLYPADQLTTDVETLQRLGVACTACSFEGGHRWSAEYIAAAGEWLDRLTVQDPV